MRHLFSVLALVALAGCTPKPTAMEACKALVTAGVAANCRAGAPKMLSALASAVVEFDLPAVKGKTGQVMSFKDARDYATTVESFRSAAMLAGPHRYGNEKALVFAQINESLPMPLGAKAKAAIEAL